MRAVSPPRCGSQRNSLTCRPRGKLRLRQPPALPVMADSFPGLQVPRTVEFSAQPGGIASHRGLGGLITAEPLLSDDFSFTNVLSRPTSRAPGRGERRVRNQSNARAERKAGRAGAAEGGALLPAPLHTLRNSGAMRGRHPVRETGTCAKRPCQASTCAPRFPGTRGHTGREAPVAPHSGQRVLLPEP